MTNEENNAKQNKNEKIEYSNTNKNDSKKETPKKNLKKVVTNDVIVKKKSVGKKIKDIFVAADFKSVSGHVIYDVLIPAARNMIVDCANKGVERLFFGESRFRRPPGPQGRGPMSKYTYQTPVYREGYSEQYRDPRTNPPTGNSFPKTGRPDFYCQTRQDADSVLEMMYDTLNVYEVVSVLDFNTLVDLPISYTDQNWGWTDLRGAEVRQERAGWIIDLPKAEPI